MPLSDDPAQIRALMDGAAATRDIYMAYLGAGFSEEQALRIVIAMITTAVTAS